MDRAHQGVQHRPARRQRQRDAADQGRQGEPAYGRLNWSPDSKALVAFRIEPGDRKEVYLIESSPPGGGRAKLQFAALRAARRQVHRLRAAPLRRRRRKDRPSADRSIAIDFGYDRRAALGQGRPHLHLREDRPRPPAVPAHRGRRPHRHSAATSSTRRPRPSSGPPTPRTSTSPLVTWLREDRRDHLRLREETAGGTST